MTTVIFKPQGEFVVAKDLKKRAARLDREARGRVEIVRALMKNYRESLQHGWDLIERTRFERRTERVIGEYIQLRKRSKRLHRRMRPKDRSRLRRMQTMR